MRQCCTALYCCVVVETAHRRATAGSVTQTDVKRFVPVQRQRFSTEVNRLSSMRSSRYMHSAVHSVRSQGSRQEVSDTDWCSTVSLRRAGYGIQLYKKNTAVCCLTRQLSCSRSPSVQSRVHATSMLQEELALCDAKDGNEHTHLKHLLNDVFRLVNELLRRRESHG